MSKFIKIPENEIQRIQHELVDTLRKMKMSCGKLTFSKDFGKIERKADLIYSEKAWLKQDALIREFDKEVAWHGIAKRGDDPEKDEYYIEDIIVYPQEVSGATVTTDQQEYQKWLMDHDDEVFNNIRMQGHSHVNMSTSPSAVDENFYESILEQLDDSMFYIFVIWNKRDQRTIKIYDLKKNILFETADVDVYTEGDYGLDDFIEEAKGMVKTKSYTSYQKSNYAKTGTGTTGVTAYTQTATKKDDNKPIAPVSPKNAEEPKKGKKKNREKYSTPNKGYGGYNQGYGYPASGYYDDYGYYHPY